jgi:hypothetical protein
VEDGAKRAASSACCAIYNNIIAYGIHAVFDPDPHPE